MSRHDIVSPWNPMSRPIDLKHMGKLSEELGELTAAVSRCLIQGIDEVEPVTGKPNRQWLEEEIADVLANIDLVIDHFNLGHGAINLRKFVKRTKLKQWHAIPDAEPVMHATMRVDATEADMVIYRRIAANYASSRVVDRDMLGAPILACDVKPPPEMNQCDGCRIKAPLSPFGNHKYPDGSVSACTKDRY